VVLRELQGTCLRVEQDVGTGGMGMRKHDVTGELGDYRETGKKSGNVLCLKKSGRE
jgi:hypothetical protein